MLIPAKSGSWQILSKDTPAKGGELMSFEPKDLEQLWQQICSSDPDQPVPARIALYLHFAGRLAGWSSMVSLTFQVVD